MSKVEWTSLNSVLAALPTWEIALLQTGAEEVELVADHVLHEAHVTINDVYFPHEGLVSLLIVLPNGSTAEAGFAGSECLIGTVYNSKTRTSFTQARVITAGRALRVPLRQFEITMSGPSVLSGLVRENNYLLTIRAQQIAACSLFHQLEPRLCRWLLQVFGSTDKPEVGITQVRLAQMLGVNRARLNESLKALEDIGAISYVRRGVLKIIDAGLIAEKTCHCYQAMRQSI